MEGTKRVLRLTSFDGQRGKGDKGEGYSGGGRLLLLSGASYTRANFRRLNANIDRVNSSIKRYSLARRKRCNVLALEHIGFVNPHKLQSIIIISSG